MAVTAAQVKELREKTGAGMLDCKKALEEANGDIKKQANFFVKKVFLLQLIKQAVLLQKAL